MLIINPDRCYVATAPKHIAKDDILDFELVAALIKEQIGLYPRPIRSKSTTGFTRAGLTGFAINISFTFSSLQIQYLWNNFYLTYSFREQVAGRRA